MSRKIEADLSTVQTVDDLNALMESGDLSKEDVAHLFERNRLPRAVMVEIDRQLGGHYEQVGLQDAVANTRNTGDIGAAGADDLIEDDIILDDSDNPPRSRGGKRGTKEGD